MPTMTETDKPTLLAAIRATNREVLLESIDGMIAQFGRRSDTYLLIRMEEPCGSMREYASRDDVPAETVPCDCGMAPEHYFILYEGAES